MQTKENLKNVLLLVMVFFLTMCSGGNSSNSKVKEEEKISVVNNLNARALLQVDGSSVWSGGYPGFVTARNFAEVASKGLVSVKFDLLPASVNEEDRLFQLVKEGASILSVKSKSDKVEVGKIFLSDWKAPSSTLYERACCGD